MAVRRIVTGIDAEGRAVIASDGPAPRSHAFVHSPGHSLAFLWATAGGDVSLPVAGDDPTTSLPGTLPPNGGTSLLVVTLPPLEQPTPHDGDPVAAAEERDRVAPDFYRLFEADSPGFHTTPTVDYAILLDGELELDLGGGVTTLVRAGDVVVQNGTRHAWRNRTSRPAVMACVMIGARTD